MNIHGLMQPPVALSAYFLKGVVPEWDLKDIYGGMLQFMGIQVIGDLDHRLFTDSSVATRVFIPNTIARLVYF